VLVYRRGVLQYSIESEVFWVTMAANSTPQQPRLRRPSASSTEKFPVSAQSGRVVTACFVENSSRDRPGLKKWESDRRYPLASKKSPGQTPRGFFVAEESGDLKSYLPGLKINPPLHTGVPVVPSSARRSIAIFPGNVADFRSDLAARGKLVGHVDIDVIPVFGLA
jgi:hypothetical protein